MRGSGHPQNESYWVRGTFTASGPAGYLPVRLHSSADKRRTVISCRANKGTKKLFGGGGDCWTHTQTQKRNPQNARLALNQFHSQPASLLNIAQQTVSANKSPKNKLRKPISCRAQSNKQVGVGFFVECVLMFFIYASPGTLRTSLKIASETPWLDLQFKSENSELFNYQNDF